MKWGTTGGDEKEPKVKVGGEEIVRVKRKEGFKALGNIVSFDGHVDETLKMRIAKAWCILWAYKHLLVCKLA